MPRKKAVPKSIYQLKVTLQRSKPPIWRRILVPHHITLEELHYVIQIAMGWENCHLHQFDIGGDYYGEINPEFDMDEWEDEGPVKLGDVVTALKTKFIYEYDFGDSWEHLLVLEKVLDPEPGRHYPVCVAGARNCPPEDCGGIWGYEEKLRILNDPQHDDYEDIKEWMGDHDPEAFDLEETNEALKQYA